MRYHFPYIGADLCKLATRQAFSEHCKTMDTGWCITRYACLLPQLLLGTHSSLTTEGGEGGSGRVDLGARFCTEVVYP